MFTAIRDKAQKWLVWAIVGLICVTFALWGVQSYFQGLTKIVVAEVDGEDISDQEYRAALEEQRALVQQLSGGKVPADYVNSEAFRRQVLETIIDRVLLIRNVSDQGHRTSDKQLTDLIQSRSEFQRDGRFDATRYDLALRNARLSPLEFEARLRQQNAVDQVQRGYLESAFVTNREVERALVLQMQEREMAYLQIKPEKFLPEIVLSESAIEEHYRTNDARFRVPEKLRVEYIQLSIVDLARKIEPTEDELRTRYENNVDQYTLPEQRHASHILITAAQDADAAVRETALEKAKTLAAQARAGADFAALAKEHSGDIGSAAQGGDLGLIARGVMVPPFEDAVFSLAEGVVSDPVETQFGFHVIKLTKLVPQKQKSFEQAREQLAADLKQERGEELFFDQAEKFGNLVYEQPNSLQPAAEELGLEIKQSDWFSRDGGPGIAATPSVVTAAFAEQVLSGEENSEVIEVDAGSYVALRLLERKPSELRPLAEVREQIEQELKVDAARKQAVELGEKMLASLRSGEALSTVAARHGVSVSATQKVSRQAAQGIDARIVDALFRAARPAAGATVYTGIDLAADGFAIAALSAVVDGDPAKAETSLVQQTRNTLLSRRGYDDFLSYRQGLRDSAEIVIHEDQL